MSGNQKSSVKVRDNNYLGAGNANAKNFWDKPIRMGEAAMLLRIRTSVLKDAVMRGLTEIDGKRLPEVEVITDVEICFKGRSVEQVLPDWINTSRSKKAVL